MKIPSDREFVTPREQTYEQRQASGKPWLEELRHQRLVALENARKKPRAQTKAPKQPTARKAKTKANDLAKMPTKLRERLLALSPAERAALGY